MEETSIEIKEAPHHKWALPVICGAQLMVVLDATIVNVALPTIHNSLHFSESSLDWLITAYALTFGGLLLLGGRTGDLFGKRRMFMIGIALFAVASLLGGFATNVIWLILTRGLQGVGGAIASPTALSLIATNFKEGNARNRAMAIYAAMAGGGGAIGLLLGGALTDYVSWRWIFFVNVPIALGILFLAPRALSESDSLKGKLDLPGAVTGTSGMLTLVYGISNASSHSWGSPGTLIPLIASGLLIASFLAIESKARSPLMPFHIFSNRNRTGSYAIMLCIGTSMFGMFFFLTQFLQNVLGWSAMKTGAGFLPMAMGIVIGAGVGSRLIGKIGPRILLLVGPVGVFIGIAWLTRLTDQSHYASIVFPLVIIALSMGLLFVSLTLGAISGVDPHETGLASALVNMGQQVGGAIGLSALSTIAIAATKSHIASLAIQSHGHITTQLTKASEAYGFTTAFKIAACIMVVSFIISVLVIRSKNIKPLREISEPALAGAS